MKLLPAGMRNNNPGNIKYVGQAGTHPSVNTDQGDPQAVYASPEAGMAAMYQLLMRKYRGGKLTPDMIIAGQGGWTPGNHQAAANVARSMGIAPSDDIGFGDTSRAARFMRALMLQEHGPASNQYSDSMITSSISGTPAPSLSPGAQDFVLNNPQPGGFGLGVPDPNNQSIFGSMSPGGSAQGGGMMAQNNSIDPNVAAYAFDKEPKSWGDRLSKAGAGFDAAMSEVKAPRIAAMPSPSGDVANGLSKLLQNPQALAQMLMKQRFG